MILRMVPQGSGTPVASLLAVSADIACCEQVRALLGSAVDIISVECSSHLSLLFFKIYI